VGDIAASGLLRLAPKKLSNFKNTCAFKHALCWSCDYSVIPIVLGQDSLRSEPWTCGRSKRYRLRGFVKFASENAQGSTIRPDAGTRDSLQKGLFGAVTNRGFRMRFSESQRARHSGS
jgi:hypothetical protein